MVDCTIHLVSLQSGHSPNEIVSQFTGAEGNNGSSVLIAGVPHGWVHKPHSYDVDILLGHDWHLFVLTTALSKAFKLDTSVISHITVDVTISDEHRKQLEQNRSAPPTAQSSTPRLPEEWIQSDTQELRIPERYQTDEMAKELPAAGALKLDASMTKFLSETLPEQVRQQPVSLFNLFKYRGGDSSVHDQYMGDFKKNFGDSAGAAVKFMGPVKSGPRDIGQGEGQRSNSVWQDANLVHYDSIYHYAYMLSTDVYQRLNKDKVRGLEDTCILMVSEFEMFRGA